MSEIEAQKVFFEVRQVQPELKIWARTLEIAFWDWLQHYCLGEEWDHGVSYGGFSGSDRTFKLRMRRQAAEWFGRKDTRAGSFLFCCWHLGLDPAAIRGRLERLKRRISQMSEPERLEFYRRYYIENGAVERSGRRQVTLKRFPGTARDSENAPENSGGGAFAGKGAGPPLGKEAYRKPHTKCRACGRKTVNAGRGLCGRCYYQVRTVERRKGERA